MINSSNNAVELNLNRGDVAQSLRSQMVPTGKIHTTEQATVAHQTNSIFLSICSNELNQRSQNSGIIISEKFTPHTKDKKSFEIVVNSKERVKVQHLQTHSKLQNNPWNYQTFCNLIADREKDAPNINNNIYNNNNNQNDSAFKECWVMERALPTVAAGSESPNLEHARKMIQEQVPGDSAKESDRRTSPVCRTRDQENAFRRIEDVHNYSKLNRYSYSNGSSNSSVHEDEEDDEEECEMEGDDEEDEAPHESFETYHFFDSKLQCSGNPDTKDSNFRNNRSMSHAQATERKNIISADEVVPAPVRPDHHARRPMNAFLIFCKRHRAIVKDRYKSFENRAITKILGDWWASLDANEKKCYTSLAQQNKDAFFSANPNFKWYKLPAPPLRTLHTRPSNTDRLVVHGGHVLLESVPNQGNGSGDHLFKLADEAQMGELSALMCDKKTSGQNALQQALGETSHYLSTHIPDMENASNKWKTGLGICYRKRLHNDNSFSSNSSEEEIVPKKSSRSCKGKIYQELINSGQIAAITKKTRTPKASSPQQDSEQISYFPNNATVQVSASIPYTAENAAWTLDSTAQLRGGDKSKTIDYCSSPNFGTFSFDLEEKIKELPALSLDAYLQRKRNTKKKKKINSKKRTTSTSSKQSNTTKPTSASPPFTPPKDTNQPSQVVGSQKRKARKESITRRDISAIENEVASLLPLGENFAAITCNGRYYFNESPNRPDPIPQTATAPVPDSAPSAEPNVSAPSVEENSTVDKFSNFLSNMNNNISSTSDLLILAEVAANRTEISN